MRRRGISHEREIPVSIQHKGEPLGTPYRADFQAGNILLELKAISSLGRVKEAQLLHCLKATRVSTGLRLNFGGSSLQVRRMSFRVRASEGLEAVSP